MSVDVLFTGISQLATPPALGPRRGSAMHELLVIDDAAMAVTDGQVTWVGQRSDFREMPLATVDLGNRAVIPALVDPHTHAIWAGDRLEDFESRLRGDSYEAILARGGGIRSTVRDTAATSVDKLVELALSRLEQLAQSGAGTVEIKSGYGFSMAAELASLEAIEILRDADMLRILPTLLIHIPPESADDRDDYLEVVIRQLIPTVAERGLATAVDVFIEREAWSAAEAGRIFEAARSHGLGVKAHSDQFHSIGGVECAIAHNALSVDHLEVAGDAQIAALAASDTVAVLLPGVTLHLGIDAAPGRRLIDAGAIVAVGTDLNPGSSPLHSTQAAMALAVRLNGLNLAEALTAATVNAAAALGLTDTGALVPGGNADFAVLSHSDWRSAAWALGQSPVDHLYIAGEEQF